MKFERRTDPYATHLRDALDAISPGISSNLDRARELPEPEAGRLIAAILDRACLATHDGAITIGRKVAAELPRQWLITRIQRVADETLDLKDEWDYRRLAELYEKLDSTLLSAHIQRGLSSQQPEIIEAANDYSQHQRA